MKLLFGTAALVSAAQAFGARQIFSYDWDTQANPIELDGRHVDAEGWLNRHVSSKDLNGNVVWEFSGDDCCMNGNRAIAGLLANKIDIIKDRRSDKEKAAIEKSVLSQIKYGARGPDGPQGDAGAKGAKGDQGPRGEPGDDGIAGSDGDKGDKGPQGSKGPVGEQGDRGNQGQKGPIGE